MIMSVKSRWWTHLCGVGILAAVYLAGAWGLSQWRGYTPERSLLIVLLIVVAQIRWRQSFRSTGV